MILHILICWHLCKEICNYSATDLHRWPQIGLNTVITQAHRGKGTVAHRFLPDLQISEETSNIEHRTSNVELRYAFGVSILLKKWATRLPRLSETTKERRSLSMSRDGGQERYPHSMFDVYPPSAAPEATRVHLFHAKQIPSGDSQTLVLWAGILCFVPGPLCLSSYMITKEKISVIISVDRWLSDYN